MNININNEQIMNIFYLKIIPLNFICYPVFRKRISYNPSILACPTGFEPSAFGVGVINCTQNRFCQSLVFGSNIMFFEFILCMFFNNF